VEPHRRDRKALALGGAAILIAGLMLYCAGVIDPFRSAAKPSPFEFPVLTIRPPEAMPALTTPGQ